MAERVMLRVLGPNGFFLEDSAAELVGGSAVSHRYRKAFGGVRPIPHRLQVAEGERPLQVGTVCLVYLENEAEELSAATRQYGWTRMDRRARYLAMGPIGSWAGLLSALLVLSISFWPVVHTVSREGSVIGVIFLIAWSIFYVPVIARSITAVWPRQWANALTVGMLMYLLVFFVGKGEIYFVEGIRDMWGKVEVFLQSL